MASLLEREASFFRSLNERIVRLAREAEIEGDVAFVCECRDPRCFRLVWMDRRDYDDLRAHDGRSVVFPEHADPDAGHIVEKHARFVLVEEL